MEKETKVKKVEKKKVSIQEEEIIINKREKSVVKFIALLSAFFASALAILTFVFGVIACVSVANLSKDVLVNNNIVVTLISKMNHYSNTEVISMINSMTNRFTFILFEIVIPTIAFIGSMVLIIILAKRAMDFIHDVRYDKDLFNEEKLGDIQEIISILSVVLLATLVIFNEPSIITYLLIEMLLALIYLLFKKTVIMHKRITK